MISFDDNLQLVSLELFDAAFPVSQESEDEVRRRFMTLFAHESGSHRGGSAEVRKATNAMGETFALKRLKSTSGPQAVGALGQMGTGASSDPMASSGMGTPTVGSQATRKELRHSLSGSSSGVTGTGGTTPDYVTSGHVAAFFEEYRVHLALSHLRGFPQLFGFGLAQGNPVIIMEWVEGLTLREALRDRAVNEPDPLPLDVVSLLGSAVVELLQRACELDERFVHRDLSPRNIMLRTDHTPASEQLRTGDFDLCLIDFGSATLHDPISAQPDFTVDTDIWRMGTPNYAPPEMLSADVALPASARQSHAIDVYALCSVLYELYGGSRPFELDPRDARSPYRVKTEDTPAPLTPREPDGGALALIIQTGLSVQQADRPTLAQLAAALDNWRGLPNQRSIGSLKGARAADASYWQPDYARRTLTRRGAIAAAVIGCSALASVGIVVRKVALKHAGMPDPARYTKASGPYDGEPLYKAYDHDFRAWTLVTAEGAVACRPASSREPGALREGMFALFDDLSQRWGFAVPAADGTVAWSVLPTFAQVGRFSQGLAAAQDAETKLWGHIDVHGSWVVPARFDAAGAFSNGGACVQEADSLLWGSVDETGKWLVRPKFRTLGTRAEDGCAVAETSHGWGIVDGDGDWVCPDQMRQLRRYACALAPACDTATGLWGFADASGNWQIEPQFGEARPFANEEACGHQAPLAAVQDARTKLWGLVEADGSAHGTPAFWKLGDFFDGLAPAQARNDDDVVVFDETKPNDKATGAGMRYGYVDADGAWQMRRLTSLINTAIGPAEI